jgi:hypothetical protein
VHDSRPHSVAPVYDQLVLNQVLDPPPALEDLEEVELEERKLLNTEMAGMAEILNDFKVDISVHLLQLVRGA